MKARLLTTILVLTPICAMAQLPQAEEVPAGSLAMADSDFLQAADAANVDQLLLGNRATGRTKSPGVRSLAENVLASHKKADSALRLLAGVKHVDLDHRTTPRAEQEADQIIRRDVDADRIYVEGVIRDDDDLIAMYQNARDNSRDADIRAYADTMLPALYDLRRQASDLMARAGEPERR